MIIPFIRNADTSATTKHTGRDDTHSDSNVPRTALVEHHPPKELENILKLEVLGEGGGKDGLMDVVSKVLKYSVNTWDQGFMDKLYASTNAVSCQLSRRKEVVEADLYV